MTRWSATQSSQTAKQIAESVERARYGRVVEVFQHVSDDDKSNFEVDVVLLDTRNAEARTVPWQSPHEDEIKIPKVGDKVVVEFIGQAKKKAIARNALYTNEDRPPKGLAGMWRKRVESGDSPAGSGDLYIESHTKYDQNPRKPDFESEQDAVPETSYIRLAKKEDDLDESVLGTDLPMNIEIVDDPAGDESYVTVELNKKDGADSTVTWGIKFDVKTGEFTLVDAEGYGIESDGSGNFTWHHEDVNFSEGTTTSL